MGDFNAVVGGRQEDRVLGKFGLGKRNDRGERLIEFCKSRNLVIANTWFEGEEGGECAWRTPGDLGHIKFTISLYDRDIGIV